MGRNNGIPNIERPYGQCSINVPVCRQSNKPDPAREQWPDSTQGKLNLWPNKYNLERWNRVYLAVALPGSLHTPSSRYSCSNSPCFRYSFYTFTQLRIFMLYIHPALDIHSIHSLSYRCSCSTYIHPAPDSHVLHTPSYRYLFSTYTQLQIQPALDIHSIHLLVTDVHVLHTPSYRYSFSTYTQLQMFTSTYTLLMISILYNHPAIWVSHSPSSRY